MSRRGLCLVPPLLPFYVVLLFIIKSQNAIVELGGSPTLRRHTYCAVSILGCFLPRVFYSDPHIYI